MKLFTLPQRRLGKQAALVGLSVSEADYRESVSSRQAAISTNASRRLQKLPKPQVTVPQCLPRPTCLVGYTQSGGWIGRLESKDFESAALEVPENSVIVEEIC